LGLKRAKTPRPEPDIPASCLLAAAAKVCSGCSADARWPGGLQTAGRQR